MTFYVGVLPIYSLVVRFDVWVFKTVFFSWKRVGMHYHKHSLCLFLLFNGALNNPDNTVIDVMSNAPRRRFIRKHCDTQIMTPGFQKVGDDVRSTHLQYIDEFPVDREDFIKDEVQLSRRQ